MATDDLKARGRPAAEFQYSPASPEQTLEAACGIIATLEAQLAARDAPYTVDAEMQKAMEPLIRHDERIKVEAEIAAWLRGQKRLHPRTAHARTCATLATAIERGDYRKNEA